MTPLKTGIVWFGLTCWEGGFFSAFLKDGELLGSCNQVDSALSFQTLILEMYVSSQLLPGRIQQSKPNFVSAWGDRGDRIFSKNTQSDTFVIMGEIMV